MNVISAVFRYNGQGHQVEIMSSAGNRRLALALYKTVLRWSAQNKNVPFSLRTSDVTRILPQLRSTTFSVNTESVAGLARWAFHHHKDLQVKRWFR
jgi:hypothetical protein